MIVKKCILQVLATLLHTLSHYVYSSSFHEVHMEIVVVYIVNCCESVQCMYNR